VYYKNAKVVNNEHFDKPNVKEGKLNS